jgi:hypothetical protein
LRAARCRAKARCYCRDAACCAAAAQRRSALRGAWMFAIIILIDASASAPRLLRH